MGLINFVKTKMFGYSPGQTIAETGMILYSQAMFLLGHTLLLIARSDRTVDDKCLHKMARIQFLFSREVMHSEMSESELWGILVDMRNEVDSMNDDELSHHSSASIRRFGRSLPEQVRKDILAYLTIFHLSSENSSRSQALVIGRIHELFFDGSSENDVRDVFRLASIKMNTLDV